MFVLSLKHNFTFKFTFIDRGSVLFPNFKQGHEFFLLIFFFFVCVLIVRFRLGFFVVAIDVHDHFIEFVQEFEVVETAVHGGLCAVQRGSVLTLGFLLAGVLTLELLHDVGGVDNGERVGITGVGASFLSRVDFVQLQLELLNLGLQLDQPPTQVFVVEPLRLELVGLVGDQTLESLELEHLGALVDLHLLDIGVHEAVLHAQLLDDLVQFVFDFAQLLLLGFAEFHR
mmetsp:Transcript_61146/g.132568  ORF Transcript_61146/g.132568 Transcript_61146/m.132568 type:complete len:228 (+) Transcript_61146:113-796(+)